MAGRLSTGFLRLLEWSFRPSYRRLLLTVWGVVLVCLAALLSLSGGMQGLLPGNAEGGLARSRSFIQVEQDLRARPIPGNGVEILRLAGVFRDLGLAEEGGLIENYLLRQTLSRALGEPLELADGGTVATVDEVLTQEGMGGESLDSLRRRVMDSALVLVPPEETMALPESGREAGASYRPVEPRKARSRGAGRGAGELALGGLWWQTRAAGETSLVVALGVRNQVRQPVGGLRLTAVLSPPPGDGREEEALRWECGEGLATKGSREVPLAPGQTRWLLCRFLVADEGAAQGGDQPLEGDPRPGAGPVNLAAQGARVLQRLSAWRRQGETWQMTLGSLRVAGSEAFPGILLQPPRLVLEPTPTGGPGAYEGIAGREGVEKDPPPAHPVERECLSNGCRDPLSREFGAGLVLLGRYLLPGMGGLLCGILVAGGIRLAQGRGRFSWKGAGLALLTSVLLFPFVYPLGSYLRESLLAFISLAVAWIGFVIGLGLGGVALDRRRQETGDGSSPTL